MFPHLPSLAHGSSLHLHSQQAGRGWALLRLPSLFSPASLFHLQGPWPLHWACLDNLGGSPSQGHLISNLNPICKL